MLTVETVEKTYMSRRLVLAEKRNSFGTVLFQFRFSFISIARTVLAEFHAASAKLER